MDPRTIYPVLPRLLCCLPHKYRQKLCCGVVFPDQVRGPDPCISWGRGWARGWCPCHMLLLHPTLSPQDTDCTDTAVKSSRVANGLAFPGQREEEGQGYVRTDGAPAYALQETSF